MTGALRFLCILSLVTAPTAAAQAVTKVDSAGVSLVTSRSALWQGKVPWSVAAEPSVVIGSAMGGAGELYVVTDALRLPTGEIVIANDGSKEVRAFDPSGRHLWSAGREGKGPAEFGRIMALGFKADTIYAWDNRNGRLARISTRGEVLNPISFDHPPFGPLSYQNFEGFVTDTTVLLFRGWFGVPASGPEGPVWDSAPNPLYHVTGKYIRNLGYSGQEQYRTTSSESAGLLWARRTSRALHDGHLYTGNGTGWEIHAFGPTGQLKKVIRLEREVPEALESKRSAWIERQIAALPNNLPAPQREQIVAYLERTRLPEREPAFGEIVADELGYLWLQEFRHLKEYALPGPRRWTILDPEGQWLGDIVLPDMEVQRIGKDWILGWRLGEFGVEEVVLHRLQRGA